MIKEEKEKSITPPTPKGLTHSPLINSNALNLNKKDAINTQENNISCNTQKNNISCEVQIPEVKKQNLETNVLLINKDLQKGQKPSSTLYNVKQVNVPKEKSEIASCAQDKDIEKPNLKISSNAFSSDNSKQSVSDFKDKVNTHSVSKAVNTKIKSDIDMKSASKIEENFISNRKEKTILSDDKSACEKFRDDKGIKKVEAGAGIKIIDQKPLAPIKDKALTITKITEDTNKKQNKNIEKTDTKLAQSHVLNSEMAKEKEIVSKTSKISDSKSKETETKTFKNEKMPEKSHITAIDSKVKIESNLGLTDKSKEKFNRKEVKDVPEVANVDFNKIIEPQRENFLKTDTSVTTKLDVVPSKQESIQFTEVPGVKNEDIKDKENSNLKLFSEKDVNKKQEASSKFSKISDFKNIEIETFAPKKPAIPGKSEIITFDSRAKTDTEIENSLMRKANAILSAPDEKSSKSVVSVLNKPDDVSNKEKIIPTSKATEIVSNKQVEDKEKLNTKLITDANVQNILNKKEKPAVSKVSKISDSKSKEIEAVIPKKTEVNTVIPKKTEVDTVIPKKIKIETVILKKTEIDTVIPEKTKIDTVFPEKTKIDTVIPEKTKIDTVIPKKTEIGTIIPKKTEIATVIPKKTEIDAIIPKKTEIDAVIPKKTEIDAVIPKKTKIDAVIPKKTEIDTVIPKKTVIKTVIPKKTEIETVIPKNTEIGTVIPKKTEIETVIPKKTEIETVIPKKTEIGIVIPQKTEIGTIIPQKTEIGTIIPQKTEIDTFIPKKTEIGTVIPKKTEIGTVIPKKTEIGTVIPKKTEIETVIPKKTEIGTVIPKKTEIGTIIPQKTEIGTVIPQKTEIGTVIPQKTEIGTVTPQKTEIDTVTPKQTEIDTVTPKQTEIETVFLKKKEMPKKSEFKTPEIEIDTKTENLQSDKKNEKYAEEPRELGKIAPQKDVKKDLKTDKALKYKEGKDSKSILPSKPEIIPEEQKILPTPKIVEDVTNKVIKDKSNLKFIAANEIQNSLNKKLDLAASKALKNVDLKSNEDESLTSKYKTEYSLPSSDSKESKKDNFQLKKTDGQNKEIIQITSQPNDVSKEKVGDSKANAISNLQKQKAQEAVGPVLLKSMTLLDTTVAQQTSSSKNSNLMTSDVKITDKQTSEGSKVNTSKVLDLSKNEKPTILFKNTMSKAPEDLLPTLKVTSGKTNISDRKVEVNGESKVTSITGSKQATLSHPAAPMETSLEEHSLKTTEQSVEASNANVVPPVDKRLVKQEVPSLVPGVPKVTENLEQNTEKVVTLTPTKGSCLDKKLVPKPTLLESETKANDSKLKSKADAETACVNGIAPLINNNIGKTNESDTPVAHDMDKNVAKVIPANKDGLTSTLNIPDGGKQGKVDDTIEKSAKVPENKNKEKNKSSSTKSNITQTDSVKEVNDSKPFMKSEEKEMPKISRKMYGNKVRKTRENILIKETAKPENEVTDKESKSVPKGDADTKGKELTNGHVSPHAQEEPEVEEIEPEYPEPKPSKLIGLFVLPKASAYKTIPESSINSDESGTDSNDETLPINTNHRKSMGKSSEYDDRGRKRISSAGSTVSTVTTCSTLSSGSEISNLSEDVRKSSLSSPQKTLKFKKYNIDDFQFLKLLGKGSFGKVLLAELKDNSLYFAVKCLKKDVVLEDDDVESTMIERRVLALGTQHPYMCKLYCTFQTESHLCFVMEYLNGGDLMFHIQESGRFEQSRAMFYGAEVASALTFLHKRGIVYRDMKLDNVVLDEEGHIRLVDFGMCQCRIYHEECQPFNFCGTPQYIAPEIVTGQKYNQSVDWWSFGVLLYEMLTGRSPFNGTDEDELFWSICNEEPHYPRFLTKEAVSILQLFLNKNPDDRLGMPSCPEGSIRQQSFFSPIDWNKLEKKQIKPPFQPRVKYASDTSNFDSNFTMDVATLTPVEVDILRSMDQEQFKGFSYTNPHITG